MNQRNFYKDVLLGVALGDAVGVPVEFKTRLFLYAHPVTEITGYGTYNLPPGTFSDDSSLTFCLAEALIFDFDLNKIAQNFIKWAYNNYWTATGTVFDIGIATRQAIEQLAKGTRPDLAGGIDELSNGNGSLMRILPLIFYIKNKPIDKRFQIVKLVSSITHAHIRSVIACFYYLEFARYLMQSQEKFEIYERLKGEIPTFLKSLSINETEILLFKRLFTDDIYIVPEDEISSTGYLLHTLEASIWCILTTDNYKDAVLKAVNLGFDTDTTGAVTGGLAGLLYGYNSIPVNWLATLSKRSEIEDLATRLENALS